MKYIQTDQILDIPEGVTVDIKARVVKVTGPRGELTKDLKHIDVTFNKINNRAIKITVHNGDRKHVAALRTVKSLIANLITGVTKGYKYKMRFVYAHFPINVNIIKKMVKITLKLEISWVKKELEKLKSMKVSPWKSLPLKRMN